MSYLKFICSCAHQRTSYKQWAPFRNKYFSDTSRSSLLGLRLLDLQLVADSSKIASMNFTKAFWWNSRHCQLRLTINNQGQEKRTVTFAPNPNTRSGWFSRSNVLSSNWTDLYPGATANFFSIEEWVIQQWSACGTQILWRHLPEWQKLPQER
jgi:hypothetical protein